MKKSLQCLQQSEQKHNENVDYFFILKIRLCLQQTNSDESLYLDEPDLFSDFDLEEVQRAKGISISTNENVFETPKSDTSSDKGSKVSNSSKVEKEHKKDDIDDEKKDEQEELDLR